MKFTKVTFAISAVTLAALSFTACGDDSSSANNESSTSYNISVDEVNHILYTNTNRDVTACVLENNEILWKEYGIEDYRDTTFYMIHGDTLIFFDPEKEDSEYRDEYRSYFIGNNNGNIYGKWAAIYCHNGQCESDSYATYTITIGKNSASVSYEINKNFNYTASDFAFYIVKGLNKGAYADEIYTSDIDDMDHGKTEFAPYLQENNIQYQASDNKNAQITINGQIYNLSISKVNETLTARELEASVSTNNITCSLKSYEYQISKETCNRASIPDTSGFHDCSVEFNGEDIEGVMIHSSRISNIDEFRSCINQISQEPYIESAPVMYKKANEKEQVQDHHKESKFMKALLSIQAY